MIDQLTVILRHNTTLLGDAALALREWSALIGVPGEPLSEEQFRLEFATVAAPLPKLASLPWVAARWGNVSEEQAVALIRRSAFAQEVFLSEEPGLLARLSHALGSAVMKAEAFSANLLIALGHNYVIETEAVLSPEISRARITGVIAALLEPAVTGRDTALSRRLRAAKKTTLSLTHDLHIYKAKFFPRMVRALINIQASGGAVFDPFCGSGTALLEASLLGYDAIGTDVDPICVTMSRSKVEPFVADRRKVKEALFSFKERIARRQQSAAFEFPQELERKIARRDRIDGTNHLEAVKAEANVLATALAETNNTGVADDLIRTLASDAVTKKIRYRFVGVGNGRYTIEIIKQPLLQRLDEKLERSLQLLDVFDELESELKISLGRVVVKRGDARDSSTWPPVPRQSLVVTSPPYLPASSGREHYASSRALAFAVLGFVAGEDGYFDNATTERSTPEFHPATEADRLMRYLVSDTSEHADPQRDAMRFERKAVPTAHYLADVARFAAGLYKACKSCRLALVVADQHTFYSHRRGEIEHVVDCATLYGELLTNQGLVFAEEIELQLVKSAASRAKPRAKDDYHEAVLIFRVPDGHAVTDSLLANINRPKEIA